MEKTALFGLGQTYGATAAGGEATRFEGVESEFADVDMVHGGLRTVGCRKKVCRLVRNNGSTALTPGLGVAFDYTNKSPGGQASGLSGALAAPIGVMDEWLPAAGLAQYDLGWITLEGPTKVVLVTGTTVVAGDKLVPAANGQFAKQDLTGATATLGNNVQSWCATVIEPITSSGAGATILVDFGRKG